MNAHPPTRTVLTLFRISFLLPIVLLAPLRAQQPARELAMTVGKSLVVNSAAPIERVSVGFGEIAEANPVGPKEVLINAKAPGETSLIIWQQGGNKLFFDIVVRPNLTAVNARVESTRREIQRELSAQDIDLKMENDTVLLRGTVRDLTSAERAVAIAGTLGKVVNLLYTDVPKEDSQILLKVQFASVDRSISTELGLNLISTGAANTIGRVTTGQFGSATISSVQPGAPTNVSLADALNLFMFRPDLNLMATIRALQARNLAEVLAEPNVLAINGKQASFLAGGEFPYPILQGGGGGLGTVTVAFREFGVRINFLPLLTPRGTIRLEVMPEVSALDFAAGLTIQGFTVPGLTTRRVHTEIELNSGQSFAIGGLLDRRLTETIDKVPGLANIPLLGRLFQSKALQKQNNELLVIVTPELVRPIPAGQPKPTLDMPVALLGPDHQPRTPGMDSTGPVPVTPPTPSMPVEKLVQSLQAQEKMMLLQNTIVGVGPQPMGSPFGTQAAPAAQPQPAAPAAPAAAPAAPATAPTK
jgi:pilus assembly protein CpaC